MKPQVPTQKIEKYTATKNACKLCAPLGASLVFKGIEGAVPLLHGSQGCSTYIRRYLISHFKEPIDIACTNFAEETAIFGGGVNLKTALKNISQQYRPHLIGIATTCLSETIGDDVPMFMKEYRDAHPAESIPPLVHVATPSYQGTHMQGFHRAVSATVQALVKPGAGGNESLAVNLFPSMVSPEDLRYLKEILADFQLPVMMLPDYSRTLDGPLWSDYHRIPQGGTKVERIQAAGSAKASLEFGRILGKDGAGAGRWLEKTCQVPCHHLDLPIGIRETDRFFRLLERISGHPTPEKYREERGRLIDSYVDCHKHVMSAKVAVYGEADLVISLVAFFAEIGLEPVVCATGDQVSGFGDEILEILSPEVSSSVRIMDNADFMDIESAIQEASPELMVGSSKGFTLSRRAGIPLVRVGFPIHDRIDAARRLHLGYRGTQRLFDRITNKLIGARQAASKVGYTYM